MKRVIVALFLIMLYTGTAFAFRPFAYMVPSAETSTAGSVLSSAGYLYGLMVITDGTNAVTVDLYDSASSVYATAAAATHLIPFWTVTTSASNRAQTLSFEPPLAYDAGIYVSGVSVGSFNIIFYYREQ